MEALPTPGASLGHQYDNLTSELTVQGGLPEGWEWDIKELNAHPPVPGEDGYWQLWDLTTHSYQPSQLVVPGLSIRAGTVTTLEPDQPATVKVVGDGPDYQVDFGIPQGKPGKNGKDGAPGKDGTDGAPGKDGQTPAITVGTVTTLDPGQDATAEITGETPNLTLNLGIPEGPPGQDGVQLNDSAVNTTEAWSSKKIVDTLCPPFTETGNPITCNPVEGYPLSAVVTLEPKQAGTGDPSPENVRPITGWDSVTVTQSKDEAQVKQITLTLPETIYGGTVDAVSGAGNKNAKIVVVDGNEIKFSPGGNPDYWNLPNNSSPGIAFESTNISNYLPPGTLKNNVKNDFIYTTATLMGHVFPTVENLNEFCAEQAEKGTPVQICYQLATPEPFQASGNQPLPAVAGLNTVYTDGDSLAVSGRQDLLYTLQNMQAQTTNLNRFIAEGGTR